MRVWAQADQTRHNSYYMRGKQKEHLSSGENHGSNESLLYQSYHPTEVERARLVLVKLDVGVQYTSNKGWLASFGPSH